MPLLCSGHGISCCKRERAYIRQINQIPPSKLPEAKSSKSKEDLRLSYFWVVGRRTLRCSPYLNFSEHSWKSESSGSVMHTGGNYAKSNACFVPAQHDHLCKQGAGQLPLHQVNSNVCNQTIPDQTYATKPNYAGGGRAAAFAPKGDGHAEHGCSHKYMHGRHHSPGAALSLPTICITGHARSFDYCDFPGPCPFQVSAHKFYKIGLEQLSYSSHAAFWAQAVLHIGSHVSLCLPTHSLPLNTLSTYSAPYYPSAATMHFCTYQHPFDACSLYSTTPASKCAFPIDLQMKWARVQMY
eukprot:scaffold47970_cov20-Tisochrysis_lutea.AAC.1